ncbi:MAG: insulinase family protein, partial [Proteobacteria bacterium]|nr:insulinase family protein [Pseudomonadota bacterium]
MNRSLVSVATFLVATSCSKPPQQLKGPVNMEPEVVVAGPATANPVPAPDEIPLWSAVKKGTLPNGLTYYILPHKKPEKRAFLWLAVNAGSMVEDDDQRGLAHFDEHMAFNGTKRFPKADIVNYLESIGMRFGADLNAFTDLDETVYQLEVPTDDAKFITRGFDILRDWAGDVSYDPVEVDKERGVVTEEWRLGRGANARLWDKQSKVLFQGSRYADRNTIGLAETLAKAPRDTLHRFYKDWYSPDLMAVVAVGDFEDAAAIEKQIAAHFGDLKSPAKPRAKPPAGVPVATGTRVSIESDPEATGTGIAIYNTVAHRPELTKANFRRDIVEDLYTQIINERLQSIGRKADAPFSNAFAGPNGVAREIDSFVRSAQVKNGKVEDTLRLLFTEVLRIERFGVTPSELDRARVRAEQRQHESAAQAATRDGRRLASEITRNFFEREYMPGAAEEARIALEILPTITKADIDAVAKSFGGAENRTILVTAPGSQPLPTQDAILKVIDEVGKAELTAWEDKVATAKLLDAPPKAGTVTKESKIDAIGVTEWKLSNGVRVIVKPADFEADQVVVGASSPGGTALASAKDYPDARFASTIADLGGLGAYDTETLQKMLAGKRANVDFVIGETTEGVAASASPKDLETMFQLIYLGFTAPRKDDDQIAVWRANGVERLKNQLASPDVQYGRRTQVAMFGDNPRRKPLDPEDFTKVNADKALAFYKDRFGDASDFTFVIIGTVELATLKPLVETYLASLPVMKRKTKDVEKDLGIKRAAGVVKKTFKLGQEPKARVQLTFHGNETWTRDLDRDMTVLGRVLSIKLRETLREDMGGVYGVGAGGNVTRVPRHERTFSVQFGCAPDKADALLAAVFAQIDKLAKTGLAKDDDVLAKVAATYTRERETALKTNGAWLGWLLESARYGDDATLILDPSKMLARMTAANVMASAKRFADQKQYFLSVLQPATPATPA